MKRSYKLCTSEGEITYKCGSNRINFQRSNKSDTIVYSISLPIFHRYSLYNFYQYTKKVGHVIDIKNDSTILLNDVNMEIHINDRRIYDLEFLGINKPYNYYKSKNIIHIKVQNIFPSEHLYVKLTGYPYFYNLDLKKIAEIKISCSVLGLDGNKFKVKREESLTL